ncbi:ubiquinone biosynthesis protein [Polymorphobacter arshaanensis]|uniref:Ubiquinone biosynthesis protein n=1 Tax=Glacieibacterium arshaanense TaxID=2511025 RepID=A0A4Y9EN52_9SPHN|nr:Coq4 family protein [Polymorphobacter arshaanensis]TFU03458.1 ubiquinone biosynthesis protein [Polymorphobacter arshaanensis]
MNAMTPPAAFKPDTKLQPLKRDWPTALKALRKLLGDKDDTVQVFEIMRALNGRATRDGYDKLLGTLGGGRMAYERRELSAVLMDREALAKYPAGSLAAHYLAFTAKGQIDAQGLADVSRQVERDSGVDLAHPYAWFGRRTRDVHDFWHILTGYDLTGLGEACLVAFSYAQTRAMGWAVIATGAALRGVRNPSAPYARAIWEGYQRGKSAKWLLAEDYEAMLGEQLEPLRARLGLTPPVLFDSIPVEIRNNGLPKD